ncbi:unnamed protein product (macronuclear) [Paramecium tetraurelia]|uniref:Uncharacterized protein n=1 Tax=Paramecium tetraurelia TaxID=5888 RepID=A0DQF6_PARTE|nr:uncharacterized protein GSPATT00002673001 [Paramecium tetraurelia]CAK85273.1 unnamed protein product [Paramecium tetraurelia]|eukprot:XP_001452670.1 hypothetical protein (macronuclear) [Paramecium tetraurelia strain d4-2]
MYRQYDFTYSPSKSSNTIDDMEQRLNAVINANEKLTLLLKEKIQENDQLKENVDILYNNNQELSEINIELCDQIKKCKNQRCASLHQKNPIEMEKELQKLKEIIVQKDRELINYQHHFEEELQLEITSKDYIDKIKGLEDQNQQLIHELDLVTKKLIESQRGSLTNHENNQLALQYESIIEDLQQKIEQMNKFLCQKGDDSSQNHNKQFLIQMEQLQVEKITQSLQLEEQKKKINKLIQELEEKNIMIDQLKKNYSLNTSKNEIMQKQNMLQNKQKYIKIEENVLELSDDIETTIKRKYISSGKGFMEQKSPRSQISDQDSYIYLYEKLQQDMQIKEKQYNELLVKKQIADNEILKLMNLMKDLEYSNQEKQILIEQYDNEIKSHHRNIRKKESEHKKNIIRQQDDIQIYEDKLNALENLKNEELKIYEQQISQTQNQLKQKELELKKLQDLVKDKNKLQNNLQSLIEEKKEIQQNLEQKDQKEEDLKAKIILLQQQLKTKEIENKNLRDKGQNQNKIYDLESQIIQLKLELEQNLINAEVQAEIIQKNEQQMKMKEFHINKLSDQLKDASNKQKELITERELENQRNYQQIDEQNDLLRKQEYEIKRLQNLISSKPLEKTLNIQSENLVLKEQIDELINQQAKLEQQVMILETQLKGKDQEIIITSQKQILSNAELQTNMRKQEADLNGKLIEKEQIIQGLLKQAQTLKQENEQLNQRISTSSHTIQNLESKYAQLEQKEQQQLESHRQEIQKKIEQIPLSDDGTTLSELNSYRMDELKTFANQLESQNKQDLIQQILDQKIELIQKNDQFNNQVQTIEELKQQIKANEEEIENLGDLLEVKEKQLVELKSQKQQMESLENQLKVKEQNLKKAQEENKELQQQKQLAVQQKKQNETQQQESKKLQDTIINQEQLMKAKDENLKKLQDQLRELNKKNEQFSRESNQNKTLKEEVEKLKTALNQKEEEQKNLQNQIGNQKKQEEQIKKLQQQIEKETKTKKEEIEKLQIELNQSNQELKQTQQLNQNYKKLEDQVKKLQQQLDSQSEKSKKQQYDSEKKEQDLKKQLKETNEQLSEWEQNDLSKDQQIEKLNKQIEELKKKDTILQKQGKIVKELQEQLKQSEKVNIELQKEKENKEAEINCQKENLEQEIKELKEQITKLQKLNGELFIYENIIQVDVRKMQELQKKIECLENCYSQQGSKQNIDTKSQGVTPRKQTRGNSAMRQTEDQISQMSFEQLQLHAKKLESIIKDAGLSNKIN